MEKRTVLFVDDERISLSAIKRMMRDEPYRSLFAASGNEAIKIMNTATVDVIVTDLMMADMDGFQLLDWVMTHQSDTIRVIVSGVNDTDSLLDAINRGSVYRYVMKPWSSEDFKIIVRQSLEMFEIQAERNRLVDQLEAANRRLRDRVTYRTNQVLDLYNQAEIGKYASQIVHNLNNPLQAIFGALDMSEIALSQSPPNHDLLVSMHKTLAKSAENLKKIIRTILFHAKDPALYQTEAVDMNAMVRDEMEFFNLNPIFRQKVTKRLRLQEDLPPVYGNFLQLKQILDNLVKNAVDAMEETREKVLTIETHSDGASVMIVIADTGEGIDQENLEKIFLADFSTKPKDKGTGLGLASVRSMVSAYGGETEVASTPGKGSTFSIRLPAHTGDSAAAEKIADAA